LRGRARESMKNWDELMAERGTRPYVPMKPQVVTHTLNKLLADDAIIACDTGTVTTWAARYLKMRGDMMFSGSGMLATMGNALPYAVGAAVRYRGRQVVAVCGDGGFTMMMGEMATLVKYRLPVKVVVIKNNVLGQIKWEQIVFEGNPQFGVELQPIDFAAYARACGAAGYTLTDPKKAEETLRRRSPSRGRHSLRRWWTPTSRRCRARPPCGKPRTSPRRSSAAPTEAGARSNR